jgi:hypothetical protein
VTSSFANHPQSATIQIPSGASGARRNIACIVHRTEAKRMVLRTEEPIAASTVLSVEYNDAMVLGEIVACRESGEKDWELDVQIEQILTGLQSLMTLRASILGEGVPPVSRSVPVTRRA